MFKIYDGREHFYQWDLDRKLIVGDRTIQAVHFCNRTGACAITRDCYDVNGMWLVDVPNLCLQESYRLKVYGFSAAKYTTVSAQFDVKSRTKPDGYVYTDDEVNCWQDLDQRVAALEENPVEQEVIDTAIEAYFAANPIEKGATDAEKEQIARNAEDIAALKAQADTYATEEYVDAAVANVKVDVDLTGYATEEYVNTAISNIEVGGGECIVNVINSTGEDTVELDKTYDEVKAMVEAGKIVVILHANNLYYLTDKNTLTFRHLGSSSVDYIRLRDANRIQYSSISLATEDSLADFQTAEQVEEAINAAKPDLTGYAKTTDIPDVSAYQTAEQVNAAIEAYVGVIENGSY